MQKAEQNETDLNILDREFELKLKSNAAFLKAWLTTIAELPALKKIEENKHGGYNYVSIDDYYEHCAKAAAKNGIGWVISERESKFIPDLGKHGAICFRYDVVIWFGDVVWPNAASFSVWHPPQGAQTAGAAASYADKLFMRTFFKVQTGEGDADKSDPNAFQKSHNEPQGSTDNFPPEFPKTPMESKQPPNSHSPQEIEACVEGRDQDGTPIIAPVQDEWLLSDVLTFLIKECRSKDEMRKLWTANSALIKGIQNAKVADMVRELFVSYSSNLK